MQPALPLDSDHSACGPNDPAKPFDSLPKGLGNNSIVNHSSLLNPKTGEPHDVRFEFDNLVLPHSAEFDAIAKPAVGNRVEYGELSLLDGDNQLPTPTMGNAFLITEAVHHVQPRAAKLGFQRAWLIVEARVDHPAVMAGLVGTNIGLSFQHHYGQVVGFDEGQRRRQPDDSSPTTATSVSIIDLRGFSLSL